MYTKIQADEISCFNRHWAERAGYWKTTQFFVEEVCIQIYIYIYICIVTYICIYVYIYIYICTSILRGGGIYTHRYIYTYIYI